MCFGKYTSAHENSIFMGVINMENDVNIIISALATLINIVKWFVFLLGVLFMFAVVLVAGGAGDTKTMPKSRVGNFFILGIFQAIVTGLTYLYTGMG